MHCGCGVRYIPKYYYIVAVSLLNWSWVLGLAGSRDRFSLDFYHDSTPLGDLHFRCDLASSQFVGSSRMRMTSLWSAGRSEAAAALVAKDC
jgi:hypothetical protein